LTTVIGVRYKSGGKLYYFDPQDMTFAEGDHVIVETARGIEFGTVGEGNHLVPDQTVSRPLRPVVRRATEEDERTTADNREKEKRAFRICEEKIRQHGLEMKLVEVEYSFEGNKILFFFTSEGRVDFRDLVKDLAGVFRTRIELRQIGVRDEAKMLGGLGICGRPFCCATFLGDFQPVSIKMAKVQNLSLSPTKISGTCGRLMCCLKYEQEAYEAAAKKMPRVNTPIDTPAGKGTISDVNLLRETVTVRYEDRTEKKTYKYESLLSGEAEEYKPNGSRGRMPQLSDSLLGIGFNAEAAFGAGEAPAAAPPAEETPEKKSGEGGGHRHHRGGRGKGGGQKNGEAQDRQQKAQKPQSQQKERAAGGEGQKSQGGGHRHHRGGRGRGGGQKSGENQDRQQRAQKPQSQQPKSGEARKSAQSGEGQKAQGGQGRGGRNKYRGRASNRPRTGDSAPKDN